jgi:hypothetical protein
VAANNWVVWVVLVVARVVVLNLATIYVEAVTAVSVPVVEDPRGTPVVAALGLVALCLIALAA